MPGPVVIDPFHRNLRNDLLEELQARRDNLCDNMAGNIEDYRYRCGTIVAIQLVLEKCQEIETRMYGDSQTAADIAELDR
jgi:hypothetical protein